MCVVGGCDHHNLVWKPASYVTVEPGAEETRVGTAGEEGGGGGGGPAGVFVCAESELRNT